MISNVDLNMLLSISFTDVMMTEQFIIKLITIFSRNIIQQIMQFLICSLAISILKPSWLHFNVVSIAIPCIHPSRMILAMTFLQLGYFCMGFNTVQTSLQLKYSTHGIHMFTDVVHTQVLLHTCKCMVASCKCGKMLHTHMYCSLTWPDYTYPRTQVGA